MSDRKHKNQDVYLVLVTVLFSIFLLPWLTLWTVKESTPTADIHIWPNLLTIAGLVALLLGIYITLALMLSWWLPGGFTGVTTFRAPSAKKRRSALRPGDRLLAGEALYSPDGRTRFRLLHDCQMVVDVQGFGIVCDAGTGNMGKASSLTLQENGELVLYDVDGVQVWHQGPHGVRLEVQDDTNVVLYPSKGPAIWATGTIVKGLGLPNAQYISPGARHQTPVCRKIGVTLGREKYSGEVQQQARSYLNS